MREGSRIVYNVNNSFRKNGAEYKPMEGRWFSKLLYKVYYMKVLVPCIFAYIYVVYVKLSLRQAISSYV